MANGDYLPTLLPCPHCGSTDLEWSTNNEFHCDSRDVFATISCNDCPAEMNGTPKHLPYLGTTQHRFQKDYDYAFGVRLLKELEDCWNARA